MRRFGLVDAPAAVGANGHACWAFDSIEELVSPAAAFLSGGPDRGQQLMFVGGPAAKRLVREQEPMRSMVTDGLLEVTDFDRVYPGYPGEQRLGNAEQLSRYADRTCENSCSSITMAC